VFDGNKAQLFKDSDTQQDAFRKDYTLCCLTTLFNCRASTASNEKKINWKQFTGMAWMLQHLPGKTE
jgi:hypothetical protein